MYVLRLRKTYVRSIMAFKKDIWSINMKTKLRVLSFFLTLTIAMIFIPAVAFADNPNTDVSDGDLDGEYCVTFSYTDQPRSIIPYDAPGAKYFKLTVQ